MGADLSSGVRTGDDGRAAASAARAVGGRILEIGVGAGLSFDGNDTAAEITGIDLCAPMLQKARAKIAVGRHPCIKDVPLMDAHAVTFADATFDCVVAQFVITRVADPERVLSECHRPNGNPACGVNRHRVVTGSC